MVRLASPRSPPLLHERLPPTLTPVCGRHPGWWLILVWVGALACGAGDGGRGGSPEPPEDAPVVDEDASLVVVVSDVDLSVPAGVGVSPLPTYVVTTEAIVTVETGEGSSPVLSARSVAADDVRELRDALEAAGLSARAMRDEALGSGPGVEVAVTAADGSMTVLTRRPSGSPGSDIVGVLSLLERLARRGEPLQVAAAGVVATAVRSSTSTDAAPWPARSRPLVDGECVEVRGDEGHAVADAVAAGRWGPDGFATARFAQDGTPFQVRLRPLVLAEQPCPRDAP